MIDRFRKLTLEEIADELPKRKNTLVIYHVRSDADAVGSAFALRELLRIMGVPVWCACADELPRRLEFLADGVQGSVLLGEDMIIDYARVIAVDSASSEQLGSLFGRLRRDVDIMIDHHAAGRPYADYYIDPNAAATGEIIYRIAKILIEKKYIDEIPMRVQNCIYAAISADTGCFRFFNTTPTVLRIAAELVENGVDIANINSALYDSKPLPQLLAESAAVENLHLYFDGRVAVLPFPYELKMQIGAEDEHLDTLIDVVRSVEGVEIAAVIKQKEPDAPIRVSLRTKENCDAAAICARFGGGGHKCAAGCSMSVRSVEEAEAKLLEAIEFFI